MICEVVFYDADDKAVASAYVETDSLREAHTVGLRLIRKQYGIDPQRFNQTVAMEILYRTEEIAPDA